MACGRRPSLFPFNAHHPPPRPLMVASCTFSITWPWSTPRPPPSEAEEPLKFESPPTEQDPRDIETHPSAAPLPCPPINPPRPPW
jgi:hypothetical protein